jgi:lipopolysaccharide biosynthesis protein
LNIQQSGNWVNEGSSVDDVERSALTPFLRFSMFWTPEREAPSAWVEHVPFAFWLVDVLRPRRIVELGTHNGVSYSAMSQAVKTLGLATSCFAIDTWKGDEHALFYGKEVYEDFAAFHDQRYGAFSQLVRSTFDEALRHFEDGSIDLLHIDGLHTYEAVRHDYQAWLPKLAANAVVLFHDTNVRERNFGVFRLWDEITAGKRHFSFLHGYGLGILGHGQEHPAALSALFDASDDNRLVSTIRETFATLGRSVRILSERPLLDKSLSEHVRELAALKQKLVESTGETGLLRQTLDSRESELTSLRQQLTERIGKADALRQTLERKLAGSASEIDSLRELVGTRHRQIEEHAQRNALLNQILVSHSWRMTRPLRFGGRLLRGEWSLVLAGLPIAGPFFERNRGYKVKMKLLLKRIVGPRVSMSLSFLLSTIRRSIRTSRFFQDVWRGENGSFAHRETYLANAQRAIGAHSPHYGACLTKPSPIERCDFQLIAYYLPQYHPIPENDQWWGSGFTEWRNVTRAFPVFVGHDQPRLPAELGYYDLRIPDVMRRQVELARLHGISAFCFHFYWFGGKRLLELPIENFLRNADLDLKFCLCWANENWTRRWDGADQEILISQSHSAEDDVALIQYLKKYFDDPRYLKIDGKPILTVYRPGILPDAKATTNRWRTAVERAGYPGIYLIATNSFGFSEYKELGFDALSEFPPHGINIQSDNNIAVLHPSYQGIVYPYTEAYNSVKTNLPTTDEALNRVVFPGVMPSWDNTARRPLRGNVFHGSTPFLFYQWLMHSIGRVRMNKAHERLVFVNAWNEWAEGAYLEPDRKFGYAYLAACAAAVSDNAEVDTRVADLFKQQRDKFKVSHRRAVAVHLYYEDLAGWFAQRIANFEDVDVYLTVPRTISWDAAKSVHEKFDSAYILEVDNRGRDIRPFLVMYPRFLEGGYDFVCKLHSKKSPHLREGNQWRIDMVEQLLSADARNALDTSRSEVGLIAPRGALESLRDVSIRLRSEKNLIELTKQLNYQITFTESFVAGSMFWFRPTALKNIHQLFLRGLQFEPELGQVDGTLAHAIERIFCVAAKAAGMSTREFGENSIKRPSQWA